MKYKLLAIIALSLATLGAAAQETARPVAKPVRFFAGIQPGFKPADIIDQWGYSVWDINVVPLTIEFALDRHWALRVHSICNMALGSYNQNGPTLSNLGLEIAAPFYLSLKNSEEGHRGFYLAPVLTPGYNRLIIYSMLGIGGEAGFSFLFGRNWSLSVAAQAGIKIQKKPGDPLIYIPRYAMPVIALGIWL